MKIPTETEIYILPTGEVVVADLPVELEAMTKELGATLPAELEAAFAGDPAARALFDAMPPSHQRETIRHIQEAKKPETRTRRAQQTIVWLHEGRIGKK